MLGFFCWGSRDRAYFPFIPVKQTRIIEEHARGIFTHESKKDEILFKAGSSWREP